MSRILSPVVDMATIREKEKLEGKHALPHILLLIYLLGLPPPHPKSRPSLSSRPLSPDAHLSQSGDEGGALGASPPHCQSGYEPAAMLRKEGTQKGPPADQKHNSCLPAVTKETQSAELRLSAARTKSRGKRTILPLYLLKWPLGGPAICTNIVFPHQVPPWENNAGTT